eukprot:25431_1
MLAQLLSFLVLLKVFYADITYHEITVDLRKDIEYYLQTIGGDFTVGNLVRYGFHTCVTGCDGCLNLNNPNNAGLDPSFDALLRLYSDPHPPSNITWSTKINNLSDFWAICSTLGNFIAIDANSYVPRFKFWIGRKACPTSPNQTLIAEFPSPLYDLAAQSEIFEKIFNLSQSQYIALIGGHTLGFAHSTASGFDTLSWTATPTTLDNLFYHDIINKEWYDTQAATNELYEWEGKDGFFMFNSDMCIYKDLSTLNTVNGQSTCDYNTCPTRPETEKQIEHYANNQTAWLNDYAVAWNIMMLAQCDVNQLTPILPSQ